MPTNWFDVVKAWVLKVPVLALLAALVCAILIAVILMATPECERRAVFGIEIDRTKLPKCANAGTKADADVNKTATAAVGSPPPLQLPADPKKPELVSPSVARPDISFAATGREDIRKKYGVSVADAETALLDETPRNTFGFAYGGSFATVWKNKLNTLTIRSAPRSVHFEVQKRGEGTVYIVGFMRGDSAKDMEISGSYPATIKLYSERYKKTDAIVAIPVKDIKQVGQSVVDIPGNKFIPVLDIGFQQE